MVSEAPDTEVNVVGTSPDISMGADTYPTGRWILGFCPSLR